MKILSIDGGGYLGLASAAFIAEAERHFKGSASNKFELFCGTSTGALIALSLAAGFEASQIVNLYKTLGKHVFGRWNLVSRTARFAKHFVFSKYSNKQLVAALNDHFGELTLGDLLKNGKKVIIASFCLTTGRPRIFKTDHSANLTLHDGYRLSDIALSSTAAPTFFPIVELKIPNSSATEYFCDGGIFANHPAIMGFAEAIGELKVPPVDIKLLSVSTPRENLTTFAKKRHWLSKGIVPWGPSLAKIAIDSTSEISHQTFLRLISGYHPQPIYRRVILDNPDRLPMDNAGPKATIALENIGRTMASESNIRNQLQDFFS